MNKHGIRGDIVIMMLLLVAALAVILIAWAQFASRQSHVVTQQTHEDKAYTAAEAGVRAALLAFNNGEEPYEIATSGSAAGGGYTLQFGGSTFPLTISSTGVASTGACQTVVAVIDSYETSLHDDTRYYIDQFDHTLSVDCDFALDGATDPVPSGPPPFVAGVSIELRQVPSGFPSPPWSQATEGDPGDTVTISFEARLSQPSSEVVQAHFYTSVKSWASATPDQDYFSISDQLLEFMPGTQSQFIDVRVIPDDDDESAYEIFFGNIHNANAAITGSERAGVIWDDDD